MSTAIARNGIDILGCMNSGYGEISIGNLKYIWHHDTEFRRPFFKSGGEFIFSLKSVGDKYGVLEFKITGFSMFSKIEIDATALKAEHVELIEKELLFGLLRSVENKVKEIRGY